MRLAGDWNPPSRIRGRAQNPAAAGRHLRLSGRSPSGPRRAPRPTSYFELRERVLRPDVERPVLRDELLRAEEPRDEPLRDDELRDAPLFDELLREDDDLLRDD